jgi:hypothetical protein
MRAGSSRQQGARIPTQDLAWNDRNEHNEHPTSGSQDGLRIVSLLGFAEWLASTPGSIALHESQYMYSIVESSHVLTLCLFLGTLVMMDLRMLGVLLRNVPVGEVAARVLPWTFVGFWIMVVTGVALFYAIPVRSYQSIFFRIKVILLIVAGLNAWHYHRTAHRTVDRWGTAARPPKSVRVSAMVSLTAWTIVIFAGRFIAYNWFDCELQPQPAFVNWAAGCVVEAE